MAFKCSSCDYVSESRSNLLRHVRSVCGKYGAAVEKTGVPCFQCRKLCGASFTDMSNRLRHEKRCGGTDTKPQKPSLPSESVLVQVGHNNTGVVQAISGNANTQQVIHINLNICGFDSFKPEDITPRKFKKLLKKGALEAMLAHIKDQQLNPQNPSNMNVFISNLKDKIARVYDGNFWQVRDGDSVVQDVYDTYESCFSKLVDDVEESEDQTLMDELYQVFQKWKWQTGHKEFEAAAHRSILLLLYNFRDCVKSTHGLKQRSKNKKEGGV